MINQLPVHYSNKFSVQLMSNHNHTQLYFVCCFVNKCGAAVDEMCSKMIFSNIHKLVIILCMKHAQFMSYLQHVFVCLDVLWGKIKFILTC